ncbi:unnamed protein product [Fraxinus pennsylvanica]|uniref:Uncharacterized protein n=1 Tax=Fraxinus pennsylvanica TaxID=56036 RepID=A0AAD2DQC4_9LAMI|nr:unnamed protein product [Fraxinus pennsylvanica]
MVAATEDMALAVLMPGNYSHEHRHFLYGGENGGIGEGSNNGDSGGGDENGNNWNDDSNKKKNRDEALMALAPSLLPVAPLHEGESGENERRERRDGGRVEECHWNDLQCFSRNIIETTLALCPNITTSGIQFATAQLPRLELMDCGMTICDPDSEIYNEEDNNSDLQRTPNSKLHLIYQKLIIKHSRLKKLSLWGCSGLDVSLSCFKDILFF